MALSRVTTWSSGQVLTASALNGEFNNILDNALSLISPITGTLDVNSNSLTNLNEVHFANSGADATAAGRLRRNAAVLSWHNGTAAVDVFTEASFTAKGGILVGTGASSATALAVGSDGQSLRALASDAEGMVYGAQGGYIYGLTLSNNGADATNDIDIAVGEASSDDAVYSDRTVMGLTSSITKRLDANWAVGTNQGGLDTGSIANDVYHVFLIMRPDTGVVDALFSASATAPTMPTNYTKKRRIGSIIRTGGAIVTFSQDGDLFYRASVLDVDVTDSGTSAVLRTLSVPDGIKVMAHVNVYTQAVATNFICYVSSPDQSDQQASITATPLYTVGQNTVDVSQSNQTVWVRTNTSAQIRTRQEESGAGDILRIATLGWIDTRGKNA